MSQSADRLNPSHALDDAVDRLRADYDATPYNSVSYPQSAPGRLAAIAYLFGLDAPEVATARVLEIGCGAGGNLIPFAAVRPNARVVGIDLSPVQIDEGRRRAKALSLDNLQLLPGDIARMDFAELGQFDFVIAHGVYSWVPPEVQQALLSAFRALLAPQGVAYVSYNVYPGWKSKEILRDAMLLASGSSVTPEEKAHEARRMVDFLEEVSRADSTLARIIDDSREHALGHGDSYLLHDELETYNSPCYFYEMLGRAAGHGLAYLAEAYPEKMIPANYGPKVAEYVNEKCGGVQVLVEQYLDFVADRTFRETLLVHAERAPQIRHTPHRSRYRRLHVAAQVPPANGQTSLDHSRQDYSFIDGATLFTNDPAIKTALDALTARWPWTLSSQELADAVQTRLAAAGFDTVDKLAERLDGLMEVLIMQGQARFQLDPVLADPVQAPLRLDEKIRRMVDLTSVGNEASTFNLWHETLMLSPIDRHLLSLLDGTRDRDALVEALLAIHRESPIRIERDGEEVSGEAELRDVIAEQVDELPQRLKEMMLI